MPRQALKLLAETKVKVKGVAGQGPMVQKQMVAAATAYKEWAKAEKDAAFVAAIDVTFDPTPLDAG